MSNGKIVVPEGAAEYATREMWTSETMMFRMPINEPWFSALTKELGQLAVKGVALWLMEHPIVPTDEQCDALYKGSLGMLRATQDIAVEWQRHMFRAPEPEVLTDPIEFLFAELLELTETLLPHETDKPGHIRQELEAYRRGVQKAAPHVD